MELFSTKGALVVVTPRTPRFLFNLFFFRQNVAKAVVRGARLLHAMDVNDITEEATLLETNAILEAPFGQFKSSSNPVNRSFYFWSKLNWRKNKQSTIIFRPRSAVQPKGINTARGTTDPRVEFISQIQTQILTKFHFQNLDQASTSKSQRNISLSTKLKLQNLGQT